VARQRFSGPVADTSHFLVFSGHARFFPPCQKINVQYQAYLATESCAIHSAPALGVYFPLARFESLAGGGGNTCG
jgi:hypothetical protein